LFHGRATHCRVELNDFGHPSKIGDEVKETTLSFLRERATAAELLNKKCGGCVSLA